MACPSALDRGRAAPVLLFNGERIPAWDCLQRKLAPASKAARSPTLPEAERLIRQPGNQLMQYNLEGTRQRMGDAFGRSVVPQRPAR
ncbi:TPA: hypothetical protein ACXIJB_001562 [Stenotrophomonas maltophilia]